MTNIYRDGYIHVMAAQCATCIFRPGNLMDLKPGCVQEMVREARRIDGTITCHSTLHIEEQAICRGFFDSYATEVAPLRLAQGLGRIREQELDHG